MARAYPPQNLHMNPLRQWFAEAAQPGGIGHVRMGEGGMVSLMTNQELAATYAAHEAGDALPVDVLEVELARPVHILQFDGWDSLRAWQQARGIGARARNPIGQCFALEPGVEAILRLEVRKAMGHILWVANPDLLRVVARYPYDPATARHGARELVEGNGPAGPQVR